MKDLTLRTRLKRVADLGQLRVICTDFAEDLGCPFYLYGLRIPTSLAEPYHLTITNYPAFWQQRYEEKAYLRVDPVVAHVVESSTPVYWDELPQFSPDTRDFFRDAADFGIADGLTTPIYGRGCEIGLFSVARGQPMPRGEHKRLNLARRVQWFSIELHEHARRRLLGKFDLPISLNALKMTEKECLLWLAEGKSADQTAKLLDITAAAVEQHLKSAAGKLGTRDFGNAVARAAALGEIHPPSYVTRSKHATPPIAWHGRTT
ncbi:MAG: hypothetical protein CMN28_12560 [Salinisphaeraceae bacterium]|nr:hypothetical protein [Salinisphaeraceae bacterium]